MGRRRPEVELDERLVDTVAAIACRAGLPEAELYERALRHVVVRDFPSLLEALAVEGVPGAVASGAVPAGAAGAALASEAVTASPPVPAEDPPTRARRSTRAERRRARLSEPWVPGSSLSGPRPPAG